ncbi:EpsG family protein [Pseudocitrobacter faecalis]|uniref:EpsG family protein n=1 Tax=Pseudocitrobacter faecalis TaxID=1398493 RepID=UPI00389A8A4D
MNAKNKIVVYNNIYPILIGVCFLALLLILMFSAYPLLMLPVIAIISPIVSKSVRIFLSFLALAFFIMFYSAIIPFSDIAEYITIYRDINNTDIYDFGRFGGGVEVFILFLMRAVYSLSNGNEYLFLFTVFSLIQILLYIFCLRVNNKLACLYFITFNLSYSFYSFNAYFLRSMLAAVILLNAFLFINKKRYYIYILAVTSHISSILFIGLWEFTKDRSKNVKFLVVVISAITVAFCIVFAWQRLAFYLFQSTGNTMGYVQLITIILNFTLCFIIIWYSNIRNEFEIKRILFLLVTNLLLAIITYKIPQNFGIRISLFLYALSPFFLYPFLKSELITFNNKILSLYLMLTINTMLLFVVLFKGDDISIYMFNKPFNTDLLEIINRCINYLSKGYYPTIYPREN